MKGQLQSLLKRLSNPGTIVGLVSGVLYVLTSAGVIIDNDKVMAVTQGICGIGVLLGFLNNSTTSGLDIPFLKGYDTDGDGVPDVYVPSNEVHEEK